MQKTYYILTAVRSTKDLNKSDVHNIIYPDKKSLFDALNLYVDFENTYNEIKWAYYIQPVLVDLKYGTFDKSDECKQGDGLFITPIIYTNEKGNGVWNKTNKFYEQYYYGKQK